MEESGPVDLASHTGTSPSLHRLHRIHQITRTHTLTRTHTFTPSTSCFLAVVNQRHWEIDRSGVKSWLSLILNVSTIIPFEVYK
jgi:hypothetical protein